MEILWRIVIALAFLYLAYIYFKKSIKIEKENDLIESRRTPKEKEELNIRQNSKHKIFIYLSIGALFLMLFLKNTFTGFFLGFGGLALNAIILGESMRNKNKDKIRIAISIILLTILVGLMAALYMPQLEYMYGDGVN